MPQAQAEIPVEKVFRSSTGIASTQKYDAAQIDKLEGLEAVRKRPGMFIGDPDERGLHHVGAKCTNALSEWFKAEVSRDGKVYHMAFARGKTTDKLTVIGEVKNKKTTGTLITFLPDPIIFTITTEFKFERLATRLRE